MQCKNIVQKFARCCHFSDVAHAPKVAVVGSGPAGFYTAQQVLKGHPKVEVDIYEKLPVPFGLVRFGIAPDHPDVKNVINTFTQTAKSSRCRFFGNVTIGRDIQLADLRQAYTAVVLAYGADDDKVFGIPGEDINGVLSARAFVGWYNGLPEHRNLKVDLDTDTAVIFGQGNVAVDVARILLTPLDILKKTDITEYALDALAKSKVCRVHLVGRRGPLQAAFTIAELREMIKLPGCKPVLMAADFTGFRQHINEIPRARKRLMELMMHTALQQPNPEVLEKWKNATRQWHLTFLRSPVSFNADQQPNRVTSVTVAVNRLEGPLGDTQKAVPTGKQEKLECGLVFRSIGYRSHQLDDTTPFDNKMALVPNKQGRVDGHPGLYCSGWIKRGPVGVITTTMNDAFETGKVITEDLLNGALSCDNVPLGCDAILSTLKQKGVAPVTYSDWEKIDTEERNRGAIRNKPREKIVDIKEMLKIVHG